MMKQLIMNYGQFINEQHSEMCKCGGIYETGYCNECGEPINLVNNRKNIKLSEKYDNESYLNQLSDEFDEYDDDFNEFNDDFDELSDDFDEFSDDEANDFDDGFDGWGVDNIADPSDEEDFDDYKGRRNNKIYDIAGRGYIDDPYTKDNPKYAYNYDSDDYGDWPEDANDLYEKRLRAKKYQKYSKYKVNESFTKWRDIDFVRNVPLRIVIDEQDQVDWVFLSKYKELPEDFIREFQDKVHWPYISRYQTLSEDFMREFQHNLDWYHIFRSQDISPEFRREFRNMLRPYDDELYENIRGVKSNRVERKKLIKKPKNFSKIDELEPSDNNKRSAKYWEDVRERYKRIGPVGINELANDDDTMRNLGYMPVRVLKTVIDIVNGNFEMHKFLGSDLDTVKVRLTDQDFKYAPDTLELKEMGHTTWDNEPHDVIMQLVNKDPSSNVVTYRVEYSDKEAKTHRYKSNKDREYRDDYKSYDDDFDYDDSDLEKFDADIDHTFDQDDDDMY